MHSENVEMTDAGKGKFPEITIIQEVIRTTACVIHLRYEIYIRNFLLENQRIKDGYVLIIDCLIF
jgi:hypothetical protein